MKETYKQNRSVTKEQILRTIMLYLLACIVVMYFFRNSGPTQTLLGLNLSYLRSSALLIIIFYMFSRLIKVLIQSKSGITFSYLLSGAALYFTLHFFFSLIDSLIPIVVINDAVPGMVMISAGYVLIKLWSITRESTGISEFQPAGKASGQIIIGLGLWLCLVDSGPFISRIGVVFFTGTIVMALCTLSAYGEKFHKLFLIKAARWMRQSQISKLVITIFIMIYILFIRSMVTSNLSYYVVIEWAIVCLIAAIILIRIIFSLRRGYTAKIIDSNWQRHVQQVTRLVDEDFTHLNTIQQRFVEDGERDYLLLYLMQLLNANKLAIEEITRLLRPLINYQDENTHWFNFFRDRQITEKQNRLKREALLSNMLKQLKDINHQSYEKIKETSYEGTNSS